MFPRLAESLIVNSSMLADKVVLVHVARGQISDFTLRPSIYYQRERHPLLMVPRVLVEFCINGMITGDKHFESFENLVVVPFLAVDDLTRQQVINFWPTGVAFLGAVRLSPQHTVISSASEFRAQKKLASQSQANRPPPSPIELAEQHVREQCRRLRSSSMRIVSNYEGTQDTTWQQYPGGIDLLSSKHIADTRKMLREFADRFGIAGAGANYDYVVGRYLHRLCAFFLGFRQMGADVYWLSYDLRRAERARARFVQEFEGANQVLSEQQRQSPAWQIIRLYSEAAFLIMELLGYLIERNQFDLEYLPVNRVSGTDELQCKNFLKAGDCASLSWGRQRVLECAESYHFFRDRFRRNDPIEQNHKYVTSLVEHVDRNYGARCQLPRTIDELLSVWIAAIDKRFPSFERDTRYLIEIL